MIKKEQRMRLLVLFSAAFLTMMSAAPQDVLSTVDLPPGFRIAFFATGIPRARQLALAPDGTVFVGTKSDTVWAIRDLNGDFSADSRIRLMGGLNSPNGVAFHDGDLYVAEIQRLQRLSFSRNDYTQVASASTVIDGLPRDILHGVKYIRFGPDGKLYVPQGMPCNVCEPSNDIYGTIMRMNPNGSGREIIARGVRNTVGFDFHPVTGELWFTDNGRDRLGDNRPPDELNRLSKPGLNFGFPYVHGASLKDPEFGARAPDITFTPPAQELGPHVAALGMRFYTGDQFPARYRNQIFIAEHGSWNRSVPIGYRITLVELSGNRAVNYSVFAGNFLHLPGGRGRPVDVLTYTDGSLLVSDDTRGVIYRISYSGE